MKFFILIEFLNFNIPKWIWKTIKNEYLTIIFRERDFSNIESFFCFVLFFRDRVLGQN